MNYLMSVYDTIFLMGCYQGYVLMLHYPIVQAHASQPNSRAYYYTSGACLGFLKGGSNISWFPKKKVIDFKRGGGPMV